MPIAQHPEQYREVRLSGCLMAIRPVAIQRSPPSCERLSRPPRVSDEGITGEGGPFIVYLGPMRNRLFTTLTHRTSGECVS